MTSAKAPLTVARLRRLRFRFSMHLKVGREHATINEADEYDLSSPRHHAPALRNGLPDTQSSDSSIKDSTMIVLPLGPFFEAK